jgi:hypothetical protein
MSNWLPQTTSDHWTLVPRTVYVTSHPAPILHLFNLKLGSTPKQLKCFLCLFPLLPVSCNKPLFSFTTALYVAC